MSEYIIKIEKQDGPTEKEIYFRVVNIDNPAINEGLIIRRIDDALSLPTPTPRKKRKDAGKPRQQPQPELIP